MALDLRLPFTEETASAKVRAAETAWNTRDPERVALACTEDADWRNRAHGNEHWKFDDAGLMCPRDMSANDVPIAESERRYREGWRKERSRGL